MPGTKHGFTAKVSRSSTTPYSPLTIRSWRKPTPEEVQENKSHHYRTALEHYDAERNLDGVRIQEWQNQYLSKTDVADVLAGAGGNNYPEATAFITITNTRGREVGRREVQLTTQ